MELSAVPTGDRQLTAKLSSSVLYAALNARTYTAKDPHTESHQHYPNEQSYRGEPRIQLEASPGDLTGVLALHLHDAAGDQAGG